MDTRKLNMPTLRSGYTYGDNTPRNLQFELNRCYDDRDRFKKCASRFGLVFLEVCDGVCLEEYLRDIKHKQKPSNIEVQTMNNNDGTYSAVVIVSYQKRISVTRCAYFSVLNWVPLMSRETRKLDNWCSRIRESFSKTESHLRLTTKTLFDRDMTSRNNHISVVKNDNQPLILAGKPGLGKTALAKKILDYQCLIVDNIYRDMRKFNPQVHKGIIFENADFRKWEVQNCLHLITPQDRTINLNDQERVTIPAETQLIFTTRLLNGKIFNPKCKAIDKMVTKTRINHPTYHGLRSPGVWVSLN